MTGNNIDSPGSWVIKLIFANIIIYLLQNLLANNVVPYIIPFGNQSFVNQFPAMTYYFGLTPALIVTKFYIWQLCTYMFLHGGFFHIFLNMYALMLFGVPIEQLWGSRKFLIYYFFTGIGAGVTIFLMNYFAGGVGAHIPTIGASGAVFGLLLAFGILFPDVELLIFFFIPMKAKYLVVMYGGIELMALLSSGGDSNVSHIGHLGGIIFGFIFFIIARRRGIEFSAKKIKARMGKEIREREKNLFNAESSTEKLSVILDKLKTGGLDAITDDEYQFIKLADILYTKKDGQCKEEDFDPGDGHCKKCETLDACLLREIMKYL